MIEYIHIFLYDFQQQLSATLMQIGFYIGPNLFLSERCDRKRKWGKTVDNIDNIEDEEIDG